MLEDTIIPASDGEISLDITFEPPIVDNLDVEVLNEQISDNQMSERNYIENICENNVIEEEKGIIHHKNNVYKLHQNKEGPVGEYYAEINWGDGFEQWPLIRISTPMDGSCLFHAIANGFFNPYHTETLRGKHIARDKIISLLRRDLSEKLASKISDDPKSRTYYDVLNGGNTSEFSQAVPEFSLKYMREQLNSNFPIGYGYMEFIGNALMKDIYILEAVRHNIYVTNELSYTIKGNRSSIVLYYINGHYELVGIQNSNKTYDTHFTPDHSFIRFLYARVQSIINHQQIQNNSD